jgi:hypothetical protein
MINFKIWVIVGGKKSFRKKRTQKEDRSSEESCHGYFLTGEMYTTDGKCMIAQEYATKR